MSSRIAWKNYSVAVVVILYCFVSTGLSQSSLSNDKKTDTKCWINQTKPMTAPGNYMDCTQEKYVKQNLTTCCTVGDTVGCCPDPSSQNGRMLRIALGILGVSLGLGILLTICLYCDKKSCPCLQKVEDRVRPKWEAMEERCGCCQSRVERRRLERKLLERQKQAAERYRASNVDGVTVEPPKASGRYQRFDREDAVNEVNLPAPPEFKQKVYGEEWF